MMINLRKQFSFSDRQENTMEMRDSSRGNSLSISLLANCLDFYLFCFVIGLSVTKKKPFALFIFVVSHLRGLWFL